MLRKRMTEEFWNQGYVIIVLNRALLSSIRFYRECVCLCEEGWGERHTEKQRKERERGRVNQLIKPQSFTLIKYRF